MDNPHSFRVCIVEDLHSIDVIIYLRTVFYVMNQLESFYMKYTDEFIHACHVHKLQDGEGDAVVVKVHRHREDGTVTPELVIIDKPPHSFFITKPQYRNHEFKKERESLDRLDHYRVPNHQLTEALGRALNDNTTGNRQKYQSLRSLCDSPFVYGADISIEVLIKHSYQKKFEASGLKATPITTGFLDIETDVVYGAGDSPNIITVTHEHRVYTAILEKFFLVKQSDGSFRQGNLSEFISFSKQTLDHHINELLDDHLKKNPKSRLKKIVNDSPFEYFYYISKTVQDLISWIWQQIHRNKTDFIGVWNIDYDIPKILNNLKRDQIPYENILCPPDLDRRYRYVRYQRDDKETDSIFKKWHWLHTTSYTQFVDSQNLYSILRTAKGKETSMKLNDVLKVNDLGGKLTFKDDDPETDNMSEIDWHRYMQKNEPYKYIVYNQFDCISLQLQERKNNDITSMVDLGGTSQLSKWTRQTRKVADSLYFDSLESRMITASPGQNMETPFDLLIPKVGGAVIKPERTSGVGLRIFSDRPDIVTMLHSVVNDVDFSGHYPTINVVMNVCKETKISCGVGIDDMTREETLDYYSSIVSIRENSVRVGKTYFGLPDYEEMDNKFQQYLAKQ